MASIDLRATMLIDSCDRLKLRVPADVAVIGVDNNDVICELCRVPLSSVSRSDLEVGCQAAALLGSLMRKARLVSEILIPPDRIVQRRSTEIVAVSNPVIGAAARYVGEHVAEPFGIERLVQAVGRSRRWLTQHFRSCLSCTPYQYICMVRVEQAKKLLAAGEKLPLARSPGGAASTRPGICATSSSISDRHHAGRLSPPLPSLGGLKGGRQLRDPLDSNS